MKHAYIFPGQGSPFYDFQTTDHNRQNERMQQLLDDAHTIFELDFTALDISDSNDARLRDARIIQPLLFLSSMADYLRIEDPRPDMVAGHSLGEFAALVAAQAITLQTALELLKARAAAMQKVCNQNVASSMAAVIGLDAQTVQSACDSVNEELGSHVRIANFNGDVQTVISGESEAVNAITKALSEMRPKSIVDLNVAGAFHSPLMAEARDEFAQVIESAEIHRPVCPIYLNTTAVATADPEMIRASLRDQMTLPVRWHESVKAIIDDGATHFHEFGPGNVLQKLVRRIDTTVTVGSASQNLIAAPSIEERREVPSTETECHLRDLWVSLLPDVKHGDVYADDSFFRLGGDSLLAIRLSQMARERGLVLSTADVLAFPQLSALAKRVAKADRAERDQFAPFSLLKNGISADSARIKAAQLCEVEPEAIEDVIPCTPLQEGLLALTARNRSSYVSRNVIRAAAGTDIDRLRQSWGTVLDTMPVLRSRIIDLPGQGLMQVVVKSGIQWGSGESIESYIARDEQSHMGLATPLSRQAIIRAYNDAFIVWTVHHAVYDGWMMSMFLDHVKKVYGGAPRPMFAPFHALIRHISLHQKEMENFWIGEMQGLEAPQFPSLPTSTYQPHADDMIVHKITGLDWRTTGVTGATIIRAAWSILSARYTDSDDVVFGATVLGRQADVPGIESMAGPTIATVPVRVLLDSSMKASELLQKLQEQVASMVAFEQMGLQNIARLNADTARACQFQTLLVVQPEGFAHYNTSEPELFQEAKIGKDDASRALKAFNNYACMIECVIGKATLEVRINFDTRIFESRQVERMASQMEHLIRLFCMASTATTELRAFDLASPSDLREIWSWNATVPSLINVVIHDLIMERAASQPDAPAVCAWDGDFTYRELDNISTRLAHHLTSRGVGRGILVPLCFEKSKWTVISMIAVMKAGGTSIAMDSTQPEERLRTIVHQAKPTILLASRANSELAARLYTPIEVVVVHDSTVDHLPDMHASTLPVVDPTDGLYVVFTSGSTGIPKGCMVSHASFSSAIRYQKDALRYSTSTRLFDFVSYAFDVTWPNALQTLAAGGCLCVPSEHERRNDISGAIQRLCVNSVHIPTSVARLIDPAAVPTVKTVVVGGEAMTITDRTRWGPGVEVIQVYGPAECTPPITAAYLQDDQADVADIGKGFGVNLWLVQPHDHNRLAGVGMVGEILVEGPLVGQGYLNDAAKTAQSFIENPRWLVDGANGTSRRSGRLYKTGDLARYSSNDRGTMLFIGRKDAQVKIRGQRVELGDVEHHVQENLTSLPGVQVVADKVTLKDSSNPMLAVFVPLGDDANDPSRTRSALIAATAGLNERLASILPAYMVPSAYIPVAELPITATGKTDRRRLRELGGSFTLEEVLDLNATHQAGEGRAPSPGVETELQELWARVLGIKPENISAEHNFLRIGGDSIGAMRLVAAAREKGLLFSAADVFERPVLSDLASIVKADDGVPNRSIPSFSLLDTTMDLNAMRQDIAAQCGVEGIQIEDVFPCTPLQEGLLSETVKRRGVYTARKVFQLPATTDMTRLESAIQKVVRLTPILRTRIVDLLNCGLVQVVLDRDAACLHADDLDIYIKEDASQTFGLQTPLTRFGLIYNSQTETKSLVWTIHHALYDGWSRPLMLEQLESAYQNQPLQNLSPFQPFIQYVRKLQKNDPAEFWESTFRDLEAVTFPIPPSPTYQCRASNSTLLKIPNLAWPRIGITASTVVRLAWAMVQSAWTNTSDIVFGVMTTGRQAPVADIERIAGPTFATIPTRIVVDKNCTVSGMLQEVQKQSTEAVAYEQTGLQYIKRYSLATERACNFQTLLVVQPPQKEGNGTTLFQPAATQANQGLKDFNSYALMLECKLEETGLMVDVSFDSTVIGGVDVERMLQQFATALRSLCEDETKTLGEISIASEEDIIAAWSWNGAVHAPCKTLFQDFFANQVLEQRHAPAVCAWDGELSYGQLDEMSTSLAHCLSSRGLKPGIVAGLYFEKSLWMSVAAVAVFKTGGAYVALDDAQPQERLNSILGTAKASLLLSSTQNKNMATQLGKQLAIDHVVVVDRASLGDMTSEPRVPLARPETSDPMIIQFTSGSTGTPKGAVLSYQNVSSFMHYLRDDLGYTRHKRVYDFASYAFDTPWANLVNTLSVGGCLCVPSRSERDNELAKSFSKYQADMVLLTSSAGRQLLAEGAPSSLRWIAYGGERLTRDEIQPLGHIEAVNCYAPCECTCIAVVGPRLTAAAADHTISCLGRGRGTNTWIVDPDHADRLAPVGAIGELWLEGPLVGMGYLGNEKMTAAAWKEDPPWLRRGSPKHPGRRARLYRTGDLVRYNEDGSLSFIGRKDAQVKLRGQRVELEEVEHHVLANLNGDHNVTLDAEIFVPKGSTEALLAVFIAVGTEVYVSRETTLEYLKTVLQGVDARLSQKVPSYMIPSAYIPIAEMPLTVTYKKNRLQLRELGTTFTMAEIAGMNPWRKQRRPPITETERQMRRLWATVLGTDENSIGVDDNFLHIGGDSIAAMRLVGAARKQGLEFTVAQLFNTPQLGSLAATLNAKHENTTEIKPFSLLPEGIDKAETVTKVAALCQVPETSVEDVYPCTPLQEGMLALTAQDADRTAYVARFRYELATDTDVDRFRSAWDRLYALTPILRTRIVDLGKAGLAQVVLSKEVPWSDSETGAERSNIMELGMALSRCELFLDPERAHTRFEWVIHHALYDGWMLGVLHRRLEELYNNLEPEYSAPLQHFIRHVMTCGEEDALHFWKNQLENSSAQVFPALPSPGYQPEPRDRLSQRVKQLEWPSNTGITPSTYIQTAWAVLSSRYTNTEESIFGITVSGRNSPVHGIEEMLSPTIATMPLRTVLDRDETISALLQRVQSQSVAAIPYAQTGLNRIRRISPEVDGASQFQTLLLVNVVGATDGIDRPHSLLKQMLDGESRPADGITSAFSTYAMTVQCDVSHDHMDISIDFDAAVVTQKQVDRITSQFQHILKQLCLPESEAISKSLGAIDFVSKSDLADIWAWNKITPPPVETCVHELFAECVRQQPAAPAICAWDGELTYHELDTLSTRLARHLIQQGLAGPGQIVPLGFDKSKWAVIAILGVMKAGAASVLIDASQPQQRLRSIVERVQAGLILCSPNHEVVLREVAECIVVVTDEKLFQHMDPSEGISLPKVQPSDTLYVSFTSGSTGQPKGVVVHHTHFASAIRYQHKSLGYESGSSRVYDFASYSFDISWSNMLQALGSGACICIPSETDRKNNIAGSFNALRANMVDLTPSISRTLSPEAMPGLKMLILGGEAVRKEDYRRWSGGGRRLIVAYGPAETTPTSTVAEIFPDKSLYNIGFGVGCCSWVVDPATDELTLVGGVGELWTEGPIVCAGYLGEPEKTAAAFVEDPPWLLRGDGVDQPGRRGRLYKTGDLVRFNPDGSLDFIARKDDQVKIRGQRIELTEIEQTIERCLPEGSINGHVLVEKIIPKGSRNPMLAAFFPLGDVATDEPTEKAVRALQTLANGLEERLAELLPAYMLPGAYIPVQRIPVTSSGKKDRKKLQEIGGRLSLEQLSRMHIARENGRQPTTEAERQLQQLFADVLGIKSDSITCDDSFFRIGGDSITAMRLAVAARDLGYSMTVADVLRHPRLVDLAEHVVQSATNTPYSSTPMASSSSDTSLSDDISLAQSAKLSSKSREILPVTDFQSLCIGAALKQPPEWWNAFYINLPASIDQIKAVEVCRALWHRFDALRTVFSQTEGVYEQQFSTNSEPGITILKTSGDLEVFSNQVRAESLSQSMSLGEKFTKFILTYDTKGRGELTLQLSHALYDGLSLSHLMEALAAFIQDQPLPPPPSFAAFIRHAADTTAPGVEYWSSLLQKSSMTRVAPIGVSGNEVIALRRRLPLITPHESVTAATIFTAACSLALSAVTNQVDVLFGRLVSGRSSNLQAASAVFGPCINFVPVRVRFDAAPCTDGADGNLEYAINGIQEQFIKGLPYENVGLKEITSSSADWQRDCGSAGGSRSSPGFGFTVQYETHDEDPRVEVLGESLTLQWHKKPAEALYDDCVAVTARQGEKGIYVTMSGPEPKLGAMESMFDILESIL